MPEPRAAPDSQSTSVSMLRLIAEHLKPIKYPQLLRPKLGPDAPPTIELIHWAIRAYTFPWIRHVSALTNGIISMIDGGNLPAVRVIGRSSFEFGAHAYYVRKHLKQHLDRNDLVAAWNFLLPVGTGSRYINEFHSTSEECEMFPVGPHVSKVINCFSEIRSKEVEEDYSYLSEFCHPNMMTLSQHYHWPTPYTIDFTDQVEIGAFGAIASSTLQGLMEIHELLNLGNERQINHTVVSLLTTIAKLHTKEAS